MGSQYNVGAGGSSLDRLLNVDGALLHLSTGDLVFLEYNPNAAAPNQVTLMYQTGNRTSAPVLIATISSNTFVLSGSPKQLALCRDLNDNLYVIGAWAGSSTPGSGYMVAQCFAKQSGLHWIAQSPRTQNVGAGSLGWGGSNTVMAGFAATWSNTGGGTNGAGHILVLIQTLRSSQNGYAVLDAGKLQQGLGSYLVSSAANTVLTPSSATTSMNGSNLDISPDGFGATEGIAVMAADATHFNITAWSINQQGSVGSGGGLSVVRQISGTLAQNTKIRALKVATATWLVVYPKAVTPYQILEGQVFSNAAAQSAAFDIIPGSNFPNPAQTRSWSLVASGLDADGVAYVCAWSTVTATTLLAAPVNCQAPTAPTVGAVATVDTAIGGFGSTNSTISMVANPVNVAYADFFTFNNNGGTYSLQGDYWTLLQAPLVSLVAPAPGGTAPVRQGYSFQWAFTGVNLGDVQTKVYFRRLKQDGATGYEWWTGSAWTAGQANPIGGAETNVAGITTAQQLTFASSSTLWAAGTAYTWSVKVVGSGATNNTSPYASDQIVLVANDPPAAPTLSAVYNSGPDNVTVTLTGNATGPTGSVEYSDDSGATWHFMRYGTALSCYPLAATLTDLEAPPLGTRQYRARVWTAAPSGYSAYTTATATVAGLTSYRLRDVLTNVTLNVSIKDGSFQTTPHKSAAAHYPLGGSLAVAISDTVYGYDGKMTLLTASESEDVQLETILDAGHALLFQRPNLPAMYLFVIQDQQVDLTDKQGGQVTGATSFREHVVSFVQIAKP